MYPMKMTFPNLATFELAKGLCQELGLHFTMEHGPREEALEGFRIAMVSGLPERMMMLQDLFAYNLQKKGHERQEAIHRLQHMLDISP